MLKPDTLALTVLLAFLTSLGPLSTDMYLPALPVIATELGASTGQAQLTLSAFLLGFAAGQFVYGPVSDRIGRKPVLLFGLGLFTLASLVCAASPSIETLSAGRELSRMGTIMGIVPALAPVIGGLVTQAGGWRMNFIVTILGGGILAAAVAWRLPEPIRQKSPHPISFPAILRGFRTLLRHPGYRVYVGLAMLTYGGLFAFISGSSFVLQGLYGLGPLPYAFSFGFMVLGYIVGTSLAQRLVGLRGLDGTIRIGVACLAAGGLTMLVLVALEIGSFMAVTGPMALYAVGVGLTMPQSMASALMPFPERAGAASSLLGICQMTFAAILGIVLGQNLGASALPLPLAIAATGTLALALFASTGRARLAEPA